MSFECERKTKVENLDEAEAMKLIFQWVKAGVIQVREFNNLVNAVHADAGEDEDYEIGSSDDPEYNDNDSEEMIQLMKMGR